MQWKSYRHIPHYQKTLTKVKNERNEMLALVLQISSDHTDLQQVVNEIAQTANNLSVSFDEALFYKWRYYKNLQNAMNLIELAEDKSRLNS
jgi:predicted O-linked N-acetylglucosamine transferase (SPINDLY family)